MPNGQQAQFDGQNPVAGYTLFHGKDGKSYYLKGENLSDDEVTSRVQKIRGGNQGTPIQDASMISARPSLGSRAWEAFTAGGPTALGEELGRSTKEAIGGLPLPGVGKTLGAGLEDLGRMSDVAASEIGLLTAPETGEGLVNLARKGVPALRSFASRTFRNPNTGKVLSPWEAAINKVIPDPYAPTAIPARSIPAGTNYGQFLRQPSPFDVPGSAPAPLPSANEFYENRGAENLAIMRNTAKAQQSQPASPFSGATSSAGPLMRGASGPSVTAPVEPLAAPRPVEAAPRGAEPLVLTPEEAASQDRLQAIAENLASRRGMQYAAGVRTAGRNVAANRLFPTNYDPFSPTPSQVRTSPFAPPSGESPAFEAPSDIEEAIRTRGSTRGEVQPTPEEVRAAQDRVDLAEAEKRVEQQGIFKRQKKLRPSHAND